MESSDNAKTVMFFSVDLSGSTAVKDSLHVHHHKPVWLEPFEAFFRNFPELFLSEIDSAYSDPDVSIDVFVWKLIGDEIIFKSEPGSASDAARLVAAFQRTIVKYDQELFKRWPLRVKGTVWAANFLQRNIEISIPERMHWKDSDQTIHSDYLGPDVDTGFRIAHHAPAGGVIISLNLAEALVEVAEEFGLRFHYVNAGLKLHRTPVRKYSK
jgi:class 3 adenylate cyclase